MVDDMPLFQFFGNILNRNAQFDHQHHDVVRQVADLVNRLFFIAFCAGDDDLGGFLADLFQDLFQTLIKQIGGVASFFRVGLAALDECRTAPAR